MRRLVIAASLSAVWTLEGVLNTLYQRERVFRVAITWTKVFLQMVYLQLTDRQWAPHSSNSTQESTEPHHGVP